MCILVRMTGELKSDIKFVKKSFNHSLRNTTQIKLRRNITNYGKKAIMKG